MTCRELTQFLCDYVGGELAPDVVREFEAHIADCPNCHVFLKQYEATIALGRAAFADPASEAEVPAELIQAILAALNRPS